MSATLGIGSAGAVDAPVADAARTLYERHGQRVFTFCFSRLRNREEAQDAAQTTFIYALQSLQRGVIPQFELAWLLKIAHNVCRSTRRTAARRATSAVADLADLPDSFASASAEANERLAGLQDALAALPENQRRAILLREWQGLSYADIAHELGLTVAAVETLIFRARRKLAERLEPAEKRRLGIWEAGSLLGFLRPLFESTAAKLAVAGAGLSLALVPVLANDVLVGRGHSAITVSTKPAVATGAAPRTERKSSVEQRPLVKHAGSSSSPTRAVLRRSPAPSPTIADQPPAGDPAPSTTQPPRTAPATPATPAAADPIPTAVPVPSAGLGPLAPSLLPSVPPLPVIGG
ncbi:MAG: RNA polymerase sigma factor [Gaiellaceae bacterium]